MHVQEGDETRFVGGAASWTVGSKFPQKVAGVRPVCLCARDVGSVGVYMHMHMHMYVNMCVHVLCVCASRAYCALFGHRIIEDEFDGHWLNNQTKDTLDTSTHQEMKPVSLVAVILGVSDGLTVARCMALVLCTLTNSLCLVCAHVTGQLADVLAKA